MADLTDLYNKYKSQGLATPSPTAAALSNPMQTLSGMAQGFGHLIKGVGGLILEVPQAVMPSGVKLPWTSSAIQPGIKDVVTGEEIPEWNQRIGKLANVATLGMREAFWNNYANTKSYDTALGQTIYDMMPTREVKSYLTGESAANPGTPLGPEEFGENLVTGIAKTVPVYKALSKVGTTLRKGTFGPEAYGREIRFKGEQKAAELETTNVLKDKKLSELDARMNELRNQIAEATAKNESPEVRLGMAQELQAISDERMGVMNIGPQVISKMWSRIRDEHPEILQDKLMQSLVEMQETGKQPERIAYQVADLIQNNKVVGESIIDLMVKDGYTTEQVAALIPLVAESWRSTFKGSGQTLQVLSRAANDFYSGLERKHPELAESIANMKKISHLGANPIPWWQGITNRFNAYSNYIRGAMVSAPTTSIRNATQGGLGLMSKLWDDTMIGTWAYATGKVKQGFNKAAGDGKYVPPTFSEAYWNLHNDLISMQETVSGGSKSLKDWFNYKKENPNAPGLMDGLEDIIDVMEKQAPGEIARLRGAPVNDLEVVNLLSNGMRGFGDRFKAGLKNVETTGDALRFGVSILNTFNTAQEMMWRKFYFTNRLRENVRRFGFQTPEEMMKYLEENKSLPRRYFGETPTVESIQQLKTSGLLDTKLDEVIKQYRIDNATAAEGKTLSNANVNRIEKISANEKQKAKIELDTIEAELAKGTPWEDMATKINPAVVRLLGGKVEHASIALTDAIDYGLKQTFAFTPPRGTLGYQALKVFQEMPFLHAIVTPFPRFMANAMEWMSEHEPSALKNVFKPGFLNELAEMTKDPTKLTNPDSVRRFAQAHTGLALWGLAKHIHENPNLGGPKYYQLKIGTDENGNEEYADLRPYSPFVQFMFIEHVAKAVSAGQMPNLTSAEIGEALLGMRRLGEVPIFALPDILRQVDASNPGAFVNAIKPILGQYLAGGFIPARIPLDIAGALGNKEATTYKDVSGNEALGPIMNNIPFVRDALPNRPDPFKGGDSRNEMPMARMVGPNVRAMTRLEQEISQTGVPLNDLLGNFDDPEADRLVRQNIGQILGQTDANGQSMSNKLGDLVARVTANKPIEVKKDIIRELFKSIREVARTRAVAQNPYAFTEYYIRQQPESTRDTLRAKVQPLKEMYNRGRQ